MLRKKSSPSPVGNKLKPPNDSDSCRLRRGLISSSTSRACDSYVHSPAGSVFSRVNSASRTSLCRTYESRQKNSRNSSPFSRQTISEYSAVQKQYIAALLNMKKPGMIPGEVVEVAMDPFTKRYKWDTEQSKPLICNREPSPVPMPPKLKIWKNPYKKDVQAQPVLIQHIKTPIDFPTQGVRVPRKKSPINRIPVYKSDTDQNKDKKPTAPKPPPMDWKDYHRLAVIDGFLNDMETSYPSLCTVGIIGKSIEGRNIKILKVSDSNATNAAVWIDSGIHAREWIGPAVNTYVANHIVKNFSKLPHYVTNKDWYFVPVINPDGYEYSHTDNRMWRKNRAWFGGKCVGVDLNRNFSFGWGGKGSSDNPTHSFYRGTAPFSEPEACAVRDVISNSGISFKVYITLHSYGQVIIFPFACRDSLCPNYIHLLQGATVMSKAIYETNGNVYKVGISTDVMYKASGTSNDWSHGAMHIPYCYLIELRSRKHKFKVPEEEIEETGNEILNCVIALMEHVDKKGYEGNVFVWDNTMTSKV